MAGGGGWRPAIHLIVEPILKLWNTQPINSQSDFSGLVRGWEREECTFGPFSGADDQLRGVHRPCVWLT